MKFTCPHCRQPALSLWQKYTAGYWRWVSCVHCHYQLSANPIILALLQMLYVWVLMTFAYLAISFSSAYILWGSLAWLVMDTCNVFFVPLSYQKPKT